MCNQFEVDLLTEYPVVVGSDAGAWNDLHLINFLCILLEIYYSIDCFETSEYIGEWFLVTG